jgi:nucleoid-associated protein YgaU
MEGTSLAYAVIINLDNYEKKQTPHTIQCMFNPKEYTFSKQNTWNKAKTPGKNAPPLEFGAGNPATLQLQLFFDTYASSQRSGEAEDVRDKYTNFIWQLMLVDPKLKNKKTKLGRPPRVRFQWGKTWTFNAVITSITQKFTLFLPNGTPVRATVDVTFQQLQDETLLSRQNPTSGGKGGERVWTVREGDTLASIAHQHFGDVDQWRRIADVNRLNQVRRLTPGTMLLLPDE